MKQLATRILFFDESTNKLVTSFDTKDQIIIRKLELSWTCDVCNHKVIRLVTTKPTYDESDLVSIAVGAFNMSFFHCKCQTKKAHANGKAATKTV